MAFNISSIFTRKKVLLLLALVATILTIQWNFLTRPKKWYHYPAVCSQPDEVVKDTAELAAKVHKVLEREQISHVLCYGSLFGAIRRQDMLPWDSDVDFCLWSDDLEKIEEGYFYRLFKFEGISLSYDTSKGAYTALYKKGRGDLIVFEMTDDYIWLQRMGLASKMKSAKDREKFPSSLIAPPLPTMKFHGMDLPVPRGGIEMQKHLYPNDWWKEIKPPNC